MNGKLMYKGKKLHFSDQKNFPILNLNQFADADNIFWYVLLKTIFLN